MTDNRVMMAASKGAASVPVALPTVGPSAGQRYEFEKSELSTWENEGGSTRPPVQGIRLQSIRRVARNSSR